MHDAVAHHAALDRRMIAAARGIRVLALASWPASVQRRFLDEAMAGRLALPRVAYPPQDFSDARRELDAVAREAGVAKGSLFQYFDDKLDLFAHLSDLASIRIGAAMAKHNAPLPWADDYWSALTESLLDRMQAMKLVAVPQFSFVHYLGDSYIRNFSREWLELSYPARDWLDLVEQGIGRILVPVAEVELEVPVHRGHRSRVGVCHVGVAVVAGQHLHVVAQVDEGLRQVAGVHALAADVGLAPIGEERDAKGCVAGHGPTSLPVD